MTRPPADTAFLPLITGSFSQPAGGNPTGVMVEAGYRAHGVNARYVNCEVAPEDLAGAVAGAWSMGWLGFNCSLPHKVSVISHLVGLGESARLIGAVNCAVRTDEGFVGENTDGKGFLESLRPVVDPAGLRVVMYGAGGAARACAVELALAGAASITVVNRDRARGEELAALIANHTPATASYDVWTARHRVAPKTDLVLNATSIGLAPDVDGALDVDPDSWPVTAVVADVIFNPTRTRLLAAAQERGCRTLDGRGMLVNQAVVGVRLWTGVDVDPAVLRAALDEVLA